MKKILIHAIFLISTQILFAQTLEPKLYANTPVDANVLFIAYDHTQGAVPQFQNLGFEDPQLKINSIALIYARAFDLMGHNTKFDIILPYSSLSGTANYNNEDVSRNVEGLGDTKARLTFNLLGAPALSLQEFSSYQQDTIIGLSIQATMPTGQYDKTKLVNIGTNRWAIKTGIGISKQIDQFTFEVDAEAEFYSTNDEFYNGGKKAQDPIYSTQAHIVYTFKEKVWLALGATYYKGGEYINDGIGAGEKLNNSRLGVTLAIPVDKQNTIKINGSTGINVTYGSDFDGITFAWQYVWAD
jgi:hypothetical protein